MKIRFLLAVSILASVGLASAEELVLATDGKCDYQVVLPPASSDPKVTAGMQQTAQLMADAFAANGFEISVVLEEDAQAGKPGIYLGDTAFARSNGVRPAEFRDWRYVHKVVGRDIIVAGCDKPEVDVAESGIWDRREVPQLATLKGVADFLRVYAGARFVLPGRTGTEFLPTPRIAVPTDLDRLVVPVLSYNRSVNQLEPIYDTANNYFPSNGLRFRGHSHPEAVPAEEYREEHPEYFALINGERDCNRRDWLGRWSNQLCISNPDVQDLIYANLVDNLKLGYSMVPLGQADAFKPCQCPECHDLYGTADDWGEKLWILHRKLAERFHREHPGGKLLLLSYQRTTAPPKTFDEFPPNVVVQLCSTDQESLDAWSRIKMPGGRAAYIYNWTTDFRLGAGMPMRTPRFVEAQVKRLCAAGIGAVYRDNVFKVIGLEAPTCYVFGRMFDDPVNNTAQALLDEFYPAAFGRAADDMKLFYDYLHRCIEIYSEFLGPRGPGKEYYDVYGRRRYYVENTTQLMALLFTPGNLQMMEKLLTRAEYRATQDGRAKIIARVALVRTEFDYVKATATVAHLYNAYKLAPDSLMLGRVLDAVDEWNGYIDTLYDARGRLKRLEGWSEVQPFASHNRQGVAFQDDKSRKALKDSPYLWDTAARRKEIATGE